MSALGERLGDVACNLPPAETESISEGSEGKRKTIRVHSSVPNQVITCEGLESRVYLSSTAVATNPVVPTEPGEFHFFADASLTVPGLTGNYINQNLQGIAGQDDWRATQTVTGTRVDPSLTFINNNW